MALGELELRPEVHEVLRCKWSLSILSQLAGGPMTFTALTRHLNVSNRVLSEKLRRLSALSLIQYSEPGLYSLSREGYELIRSVEPLILRSVEPLKLSEVLKCKWMREILTELVSGPIYTSDLRRRVDGVSWKVLSQRLRKLVGMGFVSREILPSHPVRVRYALTNTGRLTAYWLLTSRAGEYVLGRPTQRYEGFGSE